MQHYIWNKNEKNVKYLLELRVHESLYVLFCDGTSRQIACASGPKDTAGNTVPSTALARAIAAFCCSSGFSLYDNLSKCWRAEKDDPCSSILWGYYRIDENTRFMASYFLEKILVSIIILRSIHIFCFHHYDRNSCHVCIYKRKFIGLQKTNLQFKNSK